MDPLFYNGQKPNDIVPSDSVVIGDFVEVEKGPRKDKEAAGDAEVVVKKGHGRPPKVASEM